MRAYTRIMESSIFFTGGPEIDLADALIRLCDAVKASTIGVHEIGDDEITAADMIVGGFWCMTEWHGGQSSAEYAALSQLGDISKPGMTSPEDLEGGELFAYESFNDYMEQRNK